MPAGATAPRRSMGPHASGVARRVSEAYVRYMTQMGRDHHAAPARGHRTQAWQTGHDVQFYETDAFLVQRLAEHVAEGHAAGQPAIVIATAQHRRAVAELLQRRGIEVGDSARDREFMFLDARETLAAFMEGERPDPAMFEATVGNVFDSVMKGRPYVVVRAFGEMVDLLWRDGKAAAALELEQLWNALARKYSFALLCAYNHASVGKDRVESCVADICHAHSRVLQPESEALALRLGLSF